MCSGSEPQTQIEAAEPSSDNAVKCSSSGQTSPSCRLLLLESSSPIRASEPQPPEAVTDEDSEGQGKGGSVGDEVLPSVRVGSEYQASLPNGGKEIVPGRGPRPPTLLYAPGEASASSAAAGSDQASGDGAVSNGGASGAAEGSSPPTVFFSFPLPPTRPSSAAGNPEGSTLHDVVEEKQLQWQLERLGFTHHAEPLPAALHPIPRGAEWTAEERRAFDECLSRHGKRFRAMVPELPGRTVAELVEAYYKFKTHKRIRNVDATQLTRPVRQGTCGDCSPISRGSPMYSVSSHDEGSARFPAHFVRKARYGRRNPLVSPSCTTTFT
jgi:hypothetical protein